MGSRWMGVAVGLGLALGGCSGAAPPSPAPSPAARHDLAPATSGPFDARGLSFTVGTADGRTRFRQGEPIVLRLGFASNRAQTYQLDAGTYDRSGRMQVDEFEWAPRDGAVDPLADWFARGLGELGGLRTMPILGPEPVFVERELGEHVRFDRPGRYRLTVRTNRVQSDEGLVALTSAPLALEIVPAEPSWQAEALASAEQSLSSSDSDTAGAGARALRMLGTQDATRAMVRHLVDANAGEATFDLMLGVAGTPHRALAQALLTDALLAPEAPIDGTVLDLLAFFRMLHDPATDDAGWLQRRMRTLQELSGRLAAALPQKHARARTVTYATLIDLGLSGAPSSPPDWLPAVAAALPEMLPTLSDDAKLRLLAYRWRRVRSPALAPVLAALAAADDTAASVRAHVLHRLAELDPVAGRARIATEIRAVPNRLGPEWRVALLALPRAPWPALDEDLARGVGRRDYELDLRAELCARYASGAIRPRVEAVLDDRPGELSSEALGALLGWLARQAPAAAARRLQAGLADPSTHLRFALAVPNALAGAPGVAAVEDAAITLLADPEPIVAVDVASELGRSGSARVRTALSARLEAWRTTWRPRAAELVSTRTHTSPHADEVRLEVALVEALVEGRAWLLPHDEVVRLRDGSVTDWARQRIDADANAPPPSPPIVTVRFADDGTFEARIGAVELDSLDELRARLALYPPDVRVRVEVAEGTTAAELASVRTAMRGARTLPF